MTETQAGKGALPWDHPFNLGAIGVTGSSCANAAAAKADLVFGVGTRLQDFTTGSRALFTAPNCRLVQINVAPYDAGKHEAATVVGDAREVLTALTRAVWPAGGPIETRQRQVRKSRAGILPGRAQPAHRARACLPMRKSSAPCGEAVRKTRWSSARQADCQESFTSYGDRERRMTITSSTATPAWAMKSREAWASKWRSRGAMFMFWSGDGSYLMLNSELATSVALGHRLVVVVLNNRGFGCINRLQRATGGAAFNTLWEDSPHATLPDIDFVAHAASLGAIAEKAGSIAALEQALQRARQSERTHVIVIDTDPAISTAAGGAWWDVAIPEVSSRAEVDAARAASLSQRKNRRLGD